MERDHEPRATTVKEYIIAWVGATVCQHTEQQLLEGIRTDIGCNTEAIAVKR